MVKVYCIPGLLCLWLVCLLDSYLATSELPQEHSVYLFCMDKNNPALYMPAVYVEVFGSIQCQDIVSLALKIGIALESDSR